MTKSIGKWLSVLVLGGSLLVSTHSPASAAVLEKKNPVGFTKAWERYSSGDNNKAALTYGYNTTAINEDYAWANHSSKSHYASLKKGKNTWYKGPSKKGKAISKIEVIHSGGTVYYRNNY